MAHSRYTDDEPVATDGESPATPSPARDWTTDDPTRLYHPDLVVAIDARRGLNNGQPSGLALWLHFLELQPGNHILHVGCGLGYYTAVIATVVGPTGRVVAVEVDAALAAPARANLSAFDWVEVVEGDGGEYDPGQVDAILVNAVSLIRERCGLSVCGWEVELCFRSPMTPERA
jgi:SAM-dependent methyltransferase